MTPLMGSVDLPGVQTERTRHGRVVRYYRAGRGAPRVRLIGEPGTEEFAASYAAAKAGGAPVRPARPVFAAGSLGWLIGAYRDSAHWARLAPSTRRARSLILDKIVLAHGERPAGALTAAGIRAGRDLRQAKPEAANAMIKTLRALFGWATEHQLASQNPAAQVKLFGAGGDGYHTWTREEIEAYRRRWPIGSRERLVLELALHTGLRRADLCRLSPAHVRDGVLELRPQKTPRVIVTLAIAPTLEACLDQTPRRGLTYIETQRGRPYGAPSLTNEFREWARTAGCKGSLHGLRKAAATHMAEAGATTSQLMAVFGWRKAAQAETYTRAADRRRLGLEASALLDASGTSVPHLSPKRPAPLKKRR
jgi:integrase